MAAPASLGCTPSPTQPPQASDNQQPEPEPEPAKTEDPAVLAPLLAKRFIILDGHVDAPMKLAMAERDHEPTPTIHDHAGDTDFDYARAKEGGLDAPFMSIYTPARLQDQPGASKAFAEQNIAYVRELIAAHPDRFGAASTPADVRANFEAGRVSLPMGMENGSPIEDDLANVRHFYDLGIRYITLTHSKDNAICDSSYDDRHTHEGLSAFGRSVVEEMNRVGIMVDVSHVSDDTFWQVMELSAVPVIASHSSCRHFTPGFERNMSDEMIAALAERGGVIQINFGGSFVSQSYREASDAAEQEIKALFEEAGVEWGDAKAMEIAEAYAAEHPIEKVDVSVVADHVDHVVKLVGIDHVGLGSDFDGVGDSLPEGLSDVSMYPNLIRELLERGYSEGDIEKLCGANVLRVWDEVERYAASRR
ncbi:Membrane dipeptidase [Plesiocystis pacifica SIR-1]|uniref:Membrane dipeptidase n=1 Tax=Plesiocystis pacifica SIR-1 TaxID=391625 RepID=A6GCQ1_9BACT|nr:dipeptidase [Plesiocystis pacifica]EDM76317.1 Membrane dipeptidase [Plesiocystis pacifica SIR-1]